VPRLEHRHEERDAAQRRVEAEDLLVVEEEKDVEGVVLDAFGREPDAVRQLVG
jgi:hypothetical protein